MINKFSKQAWKQYYVYFLSHTLLPTGLGQGEALADEGLLVSCSLGSSTDDILIFFVDNKRRLWTGLDGAENKTIQDWSFCLVD